MTLWRLVFNGVAVAARLSIAATAAINAAAMTFLCLAALPELV